jgi:hypothetical protein
LLNRSFTREVWFRVLRQAGRRHLVPSQDDAFPDWWLLQRKRVHKVAGRASIV